MNPADLVRSQIATLRLNHPELVEDEEGWLLSLESETDLDGLLRAIERKRQEAAYMAAAVANYVLSLKPRMERFERREQSCRDLMFKLMQAADIKKRELPEATLSVANGKPKVIITDEAAILANEDLCRIKREPDKAEIKEWLELGLVVDGATLSNAEPHLTIRTK